MTDDFYEVAAARMAELSDAENDEPAVYAQDTPTPRLVIIAENIDSVGSVGSVGESDDDDCADCHTEEDQDVVYDDDGDDDANTEGLDSGVGVDSSSTAATTPDDAQVFSPKPKQPSGTYIF